MGGCSSKDTTIDGDPKAQNGPKGATPDRPLSSQTQQKEAEKSGVQQLQQKDDSSSEVEAVVCKVDDMKDGEMREVDLGSSKALLVKDFGEFSAIGHKCTHYGAPLIKGVLSNGRVRCPWHGACFNAKTGDIEDFPGIDSLPCFEVRVDGQNVIVKAKKKDLESHRRIKKMSVKAPDEDKTILIVGGGAAGLVCAETVRQEGFTGRVVLATKEKYFPYDRPRLSKSMDSKAENLQLRKADFFQVYDIEVRLEYEAVAVDTLTNSVTFQNDQTISFDYLLVATGGKPRTLNIPGNDLANVCCLRTPDDANYIAEHAQGKNVVVIGSSFIGMEVAAFLTGKAASVSVVCRSHVPYLKSLGEKIGNIVLKLAEEAGVTFITNDTPVEFKGDGGSLAAVVLKSGKEIQTDLCILGLGVTPATEFLVDTGVRLNERSYVVVDRYLRSTKSNIYAAGDIAEFPLPINNDEQVNIGHWQMAHYHGKIAALNMVGQETEVETVPFFWTALFGKNIRFAGYSEGFDDVILSGSLAEQQFVAYYTKGENVVAIATLGSDPLASKFAEFLSSGQKLKKSEIVSGQVNWQSRL